MRISRTMLRFSPYFRKSLFNFCDKKNPQPNKFTSFIKSAWNQAFPNEQDQIKKKYERVKQQKRYTQQEISQMQQEIPEYQRTAVTKTSEQQPQEQKKKFKVSNLIPEQVKSKVKQTKSYKQYSEFRDNLKEYVHTSDSVGMNLGSKAYNIATQPSTAAKAAETLKKYDKEFSLMDLQKQSTYIFLSAYSSYLLGEVEILSKLCGQQALDLLKSMLKINTIKKMKPKYPSIIDYGSSVYKQTVVKGEGALPTFIFEIRITQIYCMVNQADQIVDGDDERLMSSTYHFSVGYSGEHISQLGHPWEITELRKVDEVKLLV